MKIIITKGERRAEADFSEPTPLETLLRKCAMTVAMPCSGSGRCGKCRVTVGGGANAPTYTEKKLLSEGEIRAGVRLACETLICGDAEVVLPETAQARVLMAGSMPELTPGEKKSGLGFAVDIGTTTIAAYLFDLESGAELASGGVENPQAEYGADVISRIERSLAGEGAGLKKLVCKAIDGMFGKLLVAAGAVAGDVTQAVLAGNTAMLYLLCGDDVSSIASAPFIPSRLFGDTFSAGELGFENIPAEALVWLGRSISAYVGADITAAILASRIDEAGEPEFLVDIGTNGEMALQSQGKLLCCSTAAGPAFEGVGISCGMPARDGAINRVEAKDGKLVCHTIGGGAAAGICGTGLIDAAAAMLKLSLIDETGRVDEDEAAAMNVLTDIDDMPGITVAAGVVLTQKDIRQLQLAKAAVRAGADTLLHEAGIDESDLSKYYIAGGFGSFIDIDSAAAIGLVPANAPKIARAIGNAAGTGASMMLLSTEEQRRAQNIAMSAKTVELSSSPFFMDKYIDRMCFE